MQYALSAREENGKFYGDCREIPELSTYSFRSEGSREGNIYTALTFVLEHDYRRKGRAIPIPEILPTDEWAVSVDGVTQAKILLWNYLVEQDLTVSWLARRADMSRQSVQRIIQFDKVTSMQKVEELLMAAGFVVEISLMAVGD